MVNHNSDQKLMIDLEWPKSGGGRLSSCGVGEEDLAVVFQKGGGFWGLYVFR